jgi:thiol:disulfide interchange protein
MFGVSSIFGQLRIGDSLPGMQLQNKQCKYTVNLTSLQGKVILLDFWASWCLVGWQINNAPFTNSTNQNNSKLLGYRLIPINKNGTSAILKIS